MANSPSFEPTGLPDAKVTFKFPANRVPEWARTRIWPSVAYSTPTTEFLNSRFGVSDIGSWTPTVLIPEFPPNERIRLAYLFAGTSGFSERTFAPLAEMAIRFGHFVAVPAEDLVTPPNPLRLSVDDVYHARNDGYLKLGVAEGVVVAELSEKFGEEFESGNLRRWESARQRRFIQGQG